MSHCRMFFFWKRVSDFATLIVIHWQKKNHQARTEKEQINTTEEKEGKTDQFGKVRARWEKTQRLRFETPMYGKKFLIIVHGMTGSVRTGLSIARGPWGNVTKKEHVSNKCEKRLDIQPDVFATLASLGLSRLVFQCCFSCWLLRLATILACGRFSVMTS